MDRNFWLSLLIAMSLVVGYNMYYEARFGEYLRQQEQKAALNKKLAGTEKAENAPASEAKTASPEAGSLTAPEQAAAPVTSTFAPSPVESPTIVVDTGVARAVIALNGATLSAYALNHFTDDKGKPIDLVYDATKYAQDWTERARAAKEKGDATFSAVAPYPTLGLRFDNQAFSTHINSALFKTDAPAPEIKLAEGDQPLALRFALEDASGVTVEKTMTFRSGSYEFDVSVNIVSAPKWGEFDYALVWFGLGDEHSDFSGYYSYNGPIVMLASERLAEAPDDEKPVREYQGELRWAGMAHRYFTMFGVPRPQGERTVRASYIDDMNSTVEWIHHAGMESKPLSLAVFLGPKLHGLLNGYTEGQQSIIDYGWFDVLAKPMYWILEMFFRWTSNWGWAIIMLTVLAKVILYPLSHKGFKSMQKLQKLQPHMKRIQEAYKGDREKMNQEMLTLYREHKVNPLGGCMPMVIQIPIFFALYKVLLESIELKGADFILWIHDLSLKDPYYVTPVLMGGTMLLQQWMPPAVGDPMQRKIMMFMPVIFTVMFLSFPAGLVLYWLVNNILSIAQQWLIYREAKQEVK